MAHEKAVDGLVGVLARDLRTRVRDFSRDPLALLVFLYPAAFSAIDHEENALLAGTVPELAGVSSQQCEIALRRVLFSCMTAILGESSAGAVRQLSFFGGVNADQLPTPTNLSPNTVELFIIDAVKSGLMNRSAKARVDPILPPGVAGVLGAWQLLMTTSFTDGEDAGAEGVRLASFFLEAARVSQVVVAQPSLGVSYVPLFPQGSAKQLLPGLSPLDTPTRILLLALSTGMVKGKDGSIKDGTQFGHYEYIAVSDSHKLLSSVLDSDDSWRAKQLVARAMLGLRNVKAPLLPAAASPAALPVGCISCSMVFDKVVLSQVRCLPCGVKNTATSSVRECAVCCTRDMSSVLPTNTACDSCSTALTLSVAQRAEAKKKKDVEEAKKAQVDRDANAKILKAQFEEKQRQLEAAKQLALQKLRFPDKPQVECSKCKALFVQKKTVDTMCLSCHVAKSAVAPNVKPKGASACTNCRVSFVPRLPTHSMCGTCWGVVDRKGKAAAPKPVVKPSAVKSAQQAPKSGGTPPPAPGRVNGKALWAAVDKRIADRNLTDKQAKVLKDRVRSATDKDVSFKRILEALVAGEDHCLSGVKCDQRPRCKLKHPDEPPSVTPKSQANVQKGNNGTSAAAAIKGSAPASTGGPSWADVVKLLSAALPATPVHVPPPQSPVSQPSSPHPPASAELKNLLVLLLAQLP